MLLSKPPSSGRGLDGFAHAVGSTASSLDFAAVSLAPCTSTTAASEIANKSNRTNENHQFDNFQNAAPPMHPFDPRAGSPESSFSFPHFHANSSLNPPFHPSWQGKPPQSNVVPQSLDSSHSMDLSHSMESIAAVNKHERLQQHHQLSVVEYGILAAPFMGSPESPISSISSASSVSQPHIVHNLPPGNTYSQENMAMQKLSSTGTMPPFFQSTSVSRPTNSNTANTAQRNLSSLSLGARRALKNNCAGFEAVSHVDGVDQDERWLPNLTIMTNCPSTNTAPLSPSTTITPSTTTTVTTGVHWLEDARKTTRWLQSLPRGDAIHALRFLYSTVPTDTLEETGIHGMPMMMDDPYPAMRPRSMSSFSRLGVESRSKMESNPSRSGKDPRSGTGMRSQMNPRSGVELLSETNSSSAVFKSPHLFYSQIEESSSPARPLSSPRLPGTPPPLLPMTMTGTPPGIIGQNRPHSRTIDSCNNESNGNFSGNGLEEGIPPMTRSVTPCDIEWMIKEERGGSPASAPADGHHGAPFTGDILTRTTGSIMSGNNSALGSIWTDQDALRPSSMLLQPVKEGSLNCNDRVASGSYAAAMIHTPKPVNNEMELHSRYRPFQRRSRSFGSVADAQHYLKFAAHARAMHESMQQQAIEQLWPQQSKSQLPLSPSRSFDAPETSTISPSPQRQYPLQHQPGHHYRAGALHHPLHHPSQSSFQCYSPTPSSPAQNHFSMQPTPEKGKIPETVDWKLIQDVPSWLRSLRLHKYTAVFAGPDAKKTPDGRPYTWRDMVYLDNAGLEKVGVCALGARRKMIKVFYMIRRALGENLPEDPFQDEDQ